MSSRDTCRECGTAIPADSPGGFCAQCLLGLGLAKASEETVPIPEPKVEVTAPPTEKPGDRIGRYRLLQEIGHGGCGVVYMAEQEEPVRRKVALKVIKLGMDTRQVVARFEAERQALALMDHSSIAKVLDAGATDMGRPFFVMELVGGIKITDYCNQNQLTTRQRLDLFIQVCLAVQHAHQKGVIHRDLKPSNVLVATQDGVPVPKVIDFGIAKATQGRLTDQTVFTAFEQFLGTPAYMSPEQAQLGGIDVDTRSDIYSLGVLLYELLAGVTPFNTKELLAAGLDEMRRTIREVEPVKPSTRLTRARATNSAGSDKSALRTPHSALDKDLDWIVMKCLEKDRARRYETANGLARDIERHLSSEPVLASPPNQLYRLQKAVRRNKTAFATASVVAVVLVAGVLASTWQAIRATRAEREQVLLRTRSEANEQQAQTEAARSAQVAQFMKDMLKGVGPEVALGRDTSLLRKILDTTAQRVGHELTNQPAVEADLRATLGNVYCELADYSNAAAMHQRALDIRKQLHSGEHPDVASSLNDLAVVLQSEGRLEEAERMHRDALAMRRRLLGPSHVDVAQSLGNLGQVLIYQANIPYRQKAVLAEAEPMLREALAIQRKALGNDSIEVARTLNCLSSGLRLRKDSRAAETVAKDALNIYLKLYGNSHPALGNVSDALGLALEEQGKLAEAEAAYRQGMAARQKFLAGEHPDLRMSFIYLGRVCWNQWRLPEAEDMFRKLAAMPEQQLVYGDFIVTALSSVAQLLVAQGKLNEATAVWRDAAERGRIHRTDAMNDFAWFFATSPDAENRNPLEAVIYAEKAVTVTARKNPRYLDTLAACYAASGQFTNAVRVQREAIAVLRDTDYASRHAKGGGIKSGQESKEDYATRLRLYEGGQPYLNGQLVYYKGCYLRSQGRLAEAEGFLREWQTLREKQIPSDWGVFNSRSILGDVILQQKKYSDAEPLLLSGYEGMKEREAAIPADRKDRLKAALERLVQLYEATDRPDQAAKWKQKLAEFEKATE